MRLLRAILVAVASLLFAPLETPLAAAAQAKVRVTIEGNGSLKTRDLLADLRPWVKDLEEAAKRIRPSEEGVDPGVIGDFAEELRQIYISAGFPDAEVEALEPTIQSGTQVLTFRVTEGSRRQVGTIEFRHVGTDGSPNDTPDAPAPFAEDRLLACFNWSQSGLLSLVGQGNAIFTEAGLRAARENLILLFRLEGYLDVDVESTFDEKETDGQRHVDMQITLRPGSQYRVGALRVEDPESEAIIAAARVAKEQSFTPRLPIEIEKRIERFLAEQGYFRAKVDAEAVESTRTGDGVHRRDIELKIDRGDRATLATIEFVGAEYTRESWIQAHLPFEVGDLYKKSALQDGRGQLLRSGLFNNVAIRLSPQENDPNLLDVTIEVVEKPVLQLGTTLGFGSYQLGRFGAEARHRNLFGRGIEGWIKGRVSFKSEQVDTGFQLPIRAGDDLRFSIDGSYLRFVEPSFVRQQLRGTTALSDRFNAFNKWRFGYEVREELALKAEDSIPEEFDEDSRAALFFLQLSRDTRDSLLDPKRGHFASVRSEHADRAYGSDLDFVRLTGRATNVWTPVDGWTLVTAGRAGWIHSTGSDTVPLGERFFVGGARTFRAFPERELGPRDLADQEIGSEAYLIGNLELRYPIWKALRGAAFFEAASVVLDDEDLGHKGDRYGAGGGLMLETPLGPLRVDIGFNLNPRRDEDDWVIHFLLGHPF